MLYFNVIISQANTMSPRDMVVRLCTDAFNVVISRRDHLSFPKYNNSFTGTKGLWEGREI